MTPFLVVGDDLASAFLASLLNQSRPCILLRSTGLVGIGGDDHTLFPILPAVTLDAPSDFPGIPTRVTVTIGSDSYRLPTNKQRLLEYLWDTVHIPPRVVLAMARPSPVYPAFAHMVDPRIPEPLYPFIETLLRPFTHAPVPFLDWSPLVRVISGYNPAFYPTCSLFQEILDGLRSTSSLVEDSALYARWLPLRRQFDIKGLSGNLFRSNRVFWGSSRFVNLYTIRFSSRLLPCVVYATLPDGVVLPGVEFVRPNPDLPAWGNNFFVIAVLPYERHFSRFSSPRLIAYSIWSHRKWALTLRQGISPVQSIVKTIRSRFPTASVVSVLTPIEFENHPLRYTGLWGSFRYAEPSFFKALVGRLYAPPGIPLWGPGFPEADLGSFLSRALSLVEAFAS